MKPEIIRDEIIKRIYESESKPEEIADKLEIVGYTSDELTKETIQEYTDIAIKVIVERIAQHANNKVWHEVKWAYGYKAAIDDILEMLGERVER